MKPALKRTIVTIVAILLASSVVLVAAGCDNKAKSSSTTIGPAKAQKTADGKAFKKYENKDENIEIQYPPDWRLQEGASGAIVAFISPQKSATDMPETANIVNEDLTQQKDFTLDDYSKAAIDQLKKSIQNVKVKEDGDTTLAGQKAHQLIYTGQIGNISAEWKQVWTIKDKKAYIVSYSGTGDGFDQNIETFDKMLKSFRID